MDQTTIIPQDNNVILSKEIERILNFKNLDFRETKNGYEIRRCPFCHPDTTKIDNQFKLNISNFGLFFCHRCHVKGNFLELKKIIAGLAVQTKGIDVQTALKFEEEYHERIWIEAFDLDHPAGEPGRLYLKRRGLGDFKSTSIRVNTKLMYSDGSGNKSGPHPTLVAKITNLTNEHTASHRIYLTKDGSKAAVAEVKKAVGKIGGGYVEITSLASNQLAIAEGIETAIAVHLGTGLPTIATVSAPNMKSVKIPTHIEEVYIFADLDRSRAGEDAAETLATRLQSENKKVFLITPAADLLEDKKSVDFLDVYNFNRDLIRSYLSKATQWKPHSNKIDSGMAMRPEAFSGLAGEFVSRVIPHTEADPIAILIQFLVMYGNIVGRCCFYKIGATKHYTNIYSVLVGNSSKSRKGDSLKVCLELFKNVETDWYKKCIVKGMSSGEGIIHALRDPAFTEESVQDKNGRIVEIQRVETDPGVKDKRLLAIEGEFVSPLKTASRDGNILTVILREAWDSNPLQTLTKTSAERVMEPHFSLIGHITSFELKKYFSENDAMNGTGNRILWFMIRRSKELPHGGDMESVNFEYFIHELNKAISFARCEETIRFDEQARILWERIYSRLSKDGYGVFGTITGRAEAQVIRLALLYAVLDRSNLVTESHLKSALAVWDYSEESCRQLFGGISGHPMADKILTALRSQSAGMTRSEIRDIFNRHIKQEDLQKSLDYLKSNSLADKSDEMSSGRPGERWTSV